MVSEAIIFYVVLVGYILRYIFKF